MKFAYSPDGQEVRLNQQGVPPMLTSTCENSERVWGMKNEYYTALGGILTPLTQEAVDALEQQVSKQLAYEKFNIGVAKRKSLEDYKPLVYDGRNYTMGNNGKQNIESMYSAGMSMEGTALIPTFPATPEFAGNWVTDDDELVEFTVAEFVPLAFSVVDRFAWNYNILTTHKIAVNAIFADPLGTAEDIANYDYSGGWK